MAKLRTYAEACDELGGVPWRRMDHSERWFLAEADARPITLDSAALFIGRRSLFAGFRNVPTATWWVVIAMAALLAFAGVLLS